MWPHNGTKLQQDLLFLCVRPRAAQNCHATPWTTPCCCFARRRMTSLGRGFIAPKHTNTRCRGSSQSGWPVGGGHSRTESCGALCVPSRSVRDNIHPAACVFGRPQQGGGSWLETQPRPAGRLCSSRRSRVQLFIDAISIWSLAGDGEFVTYRPTHTTAFRSPRC